MPIACESEEGEWIHCPLFYGIDLECWIVEIEEFFNKFLIPEVQHVNLATHHIVTVSSTVTEYDNTSVCWTWCDFLEALRDEFGDDHNEMVVPDVPVAEVVEKSVEDVESPSFLASVIYGVSTTQRTKPKDISNLVLPEPSKETWDSHPTRGNNFPPLNLVDVFQTIRCCDYAITRRVYKCCLQKSIVFVTITPGHLQFVFDPGAMVIKPYLQRLVLPQSLHNMVILVMLNMPYGHFGYAEYVVKWFENNYRSPATQLCIVFVSQNEVGVMHLCNLNSNSVTALQHTNHQFQETVIAYTNPHAKIDITQDSVVIECISAGCFLESASYLDVSIGDKDYGEVREDDAVENLEIVLPEQFLFHWEPGPLASVVAVNYKTVIIYPSPTGHSSSICIVNTEAVLQNTFIFSSRHSYDIKMAHTTEKCVSVSECATTFTSSWWRIRDEAFVAVLERVMSSLTVGFDTDLRDEAFVAVLERGLSSLTVGFDPGIRHLSFSLSVGGEYIRVRKDFSELQQSASLLAFKGGTYKFSTLSYICSEATKFNGCPSLGCLKVTMVLGDTSCFDRGITYQYAGYVGKSVPDAGLVVKSDAKELRDASSIVLIATVYERSIGVSEKTTLYGYTFTRLFVQISLWLHVVSTEHSAVLDFYCFDPGIYQSATTKCCSHDNNFRMHWVLSMIVKVTGSPAVTSLLDGPILEPATVCECIALEKQAQIIIKLLNMGARYIFSMDQGLSSVLKSETNHFSGNSTLPWMEVPIAWKFCLGNKNGVALINSCSGSVRLVSLEVRSPKDDSTDQNIAFQIGATQQVIHFGATLLWLIAWIKNRQVYLKVAAMMDGDKDKEVPFHLPTHEGVPTVINIFVILLDFKDEFLVFLVEDNWLYSAWDVTASIWLFDPGISCQSPAVQLWCLGVRSLLWCFLKQPMDVGVINSCAVNKHYVPNLQRYNSCATLLLLISEFDDWLYKSVLFSVNTNALDKKNAWLHHQYQFFVTTKSYLMCLTSAWCLDLKISSKTSIRSIIHNSHFKLSCGWRP